MTIESERGWRFRGRTAALSRIISWLDRTTPDRQVLVVTGSPGVGKSAVLGRIITTADASIRALLPPGDQAVRASTGSVSCAVHAKGKSALDVAEEIARAASAALPERPEDLAPAIREALNERVNTRFNVVIDALDEAASPAQGRLIVDAIVRPLAETCSDVGAQVVVGTRRRDDGGDLLNRFGAALEALDLDEPEYFVEEDLAAYALACIQLAGDERLGNPYADDTLAIPMARRIAAMSGQNFLVAGLVGRSHGLHDKEAIHLDRLEFAATVDSALATYLEQLSPVAQLPAAHVLTALAFAEVPGWPVELWRLAVEAIYEVKVSTEDLVRFARSSAGNFLVETGRSVSLDVRGAQEGPVYRLFHQALNDTLLHVRADVTPQASDERALTRAFATRGRVSDWNEAALEYLLRSLPKHAQVAGLVDDLLCDDTYLLHADLRRLMQVADDASSELGRQRTRLLWLTPRAITATADERAALFSVTEALDELGTTYRGERWQAPYRAEWALVEPRRERAVLEGHQDRVNAVCPITVSGQQLLASASSDGTVRLWDPQTGEQYTVLEGHQAAINAVCPIIVNGQQLLATASDDETVRLWEPGSGKQLANLGRHPRQAIAACPITVNGQQLLATADRLGTVRLWNPQTKNYYVLRGHQNAVNAVCLITVNGQQLLATASDDRTLWLRDPQTGEQHTVLEGHQAAINAVCPITVNGQQLLATASDDGTVRLWDPQTGEQHTVLEGHQAAINAVCPITVNGQQLLATASDDGTVRLWDPQTGEQHILLGGDQAAINAVCPITVNGQQLLATGGNDRTVRLWEPSTGQQHMLSETAQNKVSSMCAITAGGEQLLVSGGNLGTIRLWDPKTGEQRTLLEDHPYGINAVCPITVSRQHLLASGSNEQRVRLWETRNGREITVFGRHPGGISAMCSITVNGQQLLATGGNDWTVRLWDPKTGQEHTILEDHQGRINAVCPVTVSGHQLLASASSDGTVRLRDPQTGEQHAILEGHQAAINAMCPITVNGQQLLATGSDDWTVRLWDPKNGQQRTLLGDHQQQVNALCLVTFDGQQLLASASDDRTVRLWDLQAGACRLTVPTHYVALRVAAVANILAIGLDKGIFLIKLNSTEPAENVHQALERDREQSALSQPYFLTQDEIDDENNTA
jgi:WD40 repeat protein